jgi:arylsulfatase A-like enzyme
LLGNNALPNIVIVFTDDQGYQDLGCFGAEGFETPNVDRMASQGMKFTDFYATASLCSPSRAALLTGRYPLRAGIPKVLYPYSTEGLSSDEITIAEMLKQKDYATACIGKWHLGHHPRYLPPHHGFDVYFGLPYSNDMTPDAVKNPNPRARSYPPVPLVRQTETIELEPDQSQLVKQYTAEAVAFIEANRDRPFFLYFPHTFPHVPLYASADFEGSTERGLYGDVIAEIDWSVGEVLESLKRTGVDDRTLVIFTSDNGPWLVKGENSGSAEPLREGKATAFEGGHRVPCVMRWPGKIPPGTTCRRMATTMDILPTIARITGTELPKDRIIDGQDIWPLLSGSADDAYRHKPFYYYRDTGLYAVRSGKWKLVVPHTYGSIEGATLATPTDPGTYARRQTDLALYDLEKDPGETTNLAASHPDVVARLEELLEESRQDLGDSLTESKSEGL